MLRISLLLGFVLAGLTFFNIIATAIPFTLHSHGKGAVPVASNATEIVTEHAKIYGIPQIVKVTNSIHVGIGYALANMIMIEGTDGIIIVDTTESSKVALAIFAAFRNITSKPLKAIISTHFHSDHNCGTKALLEATKDEGEDVRIFGHATTEAAVKRNHLLREVGAVRGLRQFGFILSRGSEHLDSGIGPLLNLNRGNLCTFIPPTDTFEEEASYTVAGVNFKLIYTPGESDDQITVWIPEWRVAMPGDNIYEAFPNLYPIRGAPTRNAKDWYQSLDKVRRLHPNILIPSHTNPIIGEEEVCSVLTHYRDGIQYIYDQTIHLINEGVDLDIITERVRLPTSLASHPFLREFYGQVSWSVRGVFDGELGWFDGDPVNLNPISKQERAKKIMDLLKIQDQGQSSEEKVMNQAKKSFNAFISHLNATGEVYRDDLQWSLELCSLVMKTACTDTDIYKEAKSLMISVLRTMATYTTNSNGRNYYMTFAKELEYDFNLAPPKGRAALLMGSEIDEVMSRLPTLYDANHCTDKLEATVVLVFSDVEKTYSYTLRHCILEHHADAIPEKYDVKLILTFNLFKEILTGKQSALKAFSSGDIDVRGEMSRSDAFKQFFDNGILLTNVITANENAFK